ncbi:DUF5819 family protein [Kitasatospora sp. NPDC059571]|uniref:DUF5819 family protein n=1 Tax=Kitasatospora sp. NPDC059571 TaxID=3346871 RepID=UPI0036BBE2C5
MLLALVPAVLFSFACLVYNAPASPARNRVAAEATSFMEPYFWQDWQLFGPTPGDSNTLIYLQAEVRDASGKVVQTSPVEIEEAIDRAPQQFRINPTKLPGVPLAFNEFAQRYTQAAGNIKKLPEAERTRAQKEIDETYRTDFLQLQRFLSAQAATLYPEQDVVAVKASFKHRPIVPFSQRYQSPQPQQPVNPMLETSWLDYVPGVAR